MTTFISVNKHIIASNAKHGSNDPPLRIARRNSDAKPTYAHEVEIDGPSKLIYDAGKPILRCGVRLAIATDANVRVIR